MKVKKYLAPSMNEAMKRIREELGSDAVILFKGCIYWWFLRVIQEEEY
ncbi:hypothetical protein [Peribacillus sp. FSL M8-0224]